jgi:hypothetical protein
MPGIVVTGLQETIEMLRTAPNIVVANGFLRAFHAAGNVVAAELEINTPIKAEDTGGVLDRGELRESVGVSVEIDTNLRGGAAWVGFTTANSADAVALWLDMGHRIITKHGKVLGQTIGTGFMRRTADMSSDRAIEAFRAEIEATIKANFPQEVAA